jgi:hypothetical protein
VSDRRQLVVHFGNEEHNTAHHLAAALRRLGVDVVCEGRGHPPTAGRPEPDAPLLWVESGFASFPAAEELDRRPSAAWLIDTHRGLDWRAPLGAAFDVCFVAQRDAVAPLAGAGAHARWLPLACPDPGPEPGPKAGGRSIPVAFVGFVEPGSRRQRILDALARHHEVDRNQGYVPPAEMMRRYAAARVVVNVPLAGDLNMRLFEAAGAGAYVVTGPMEGLDEVLPADLVTVVDSDDPADWVAAVSRALADERTGDRARRAAALIAAGHRYVDRARTVLDALAALERRPVPLDDRRRRLLGAAVARHAFADAWRISAGSLRGRAALAAALVPEGARSVRRRLGRGVPR